VEHWLRTEVVAAHDAYVKDPSEAISADQLRAALAKHHAGQK
jgi:hypothetical protein